MIRIAIIDPQFAEDPDIERAVAGVDVEFDIVRPGSDAVPAEPLRQVDGIVNCRSRHRLPSSLVDAMERTKVIVQAGVGFNHIDIDACARKGIPVCNTPDYGTREVADHTIGLILSLMRGIPTYNERLLSRDDAWNTLALPVPPIRRLSGRVLGIVGLGRIGSAVAMRAKAFELDIVFFDPGLPPGAELGLSLRRVDTLEELLRQSDIVTLHCPMTPASFHLIDEKALSAMKPGAILINTARGEHIDLDAVETALRSGHLCAAALDVLPREPLDRSHPLLAAWSRQEAWLEGRLILTPHAAFYTPESLADMRRLAMLATITFLRNGRLRSCVNLRQLAANGYALAENI